MNKKIKELIERNVKVIYVYDNGKVEIKYKR